MKKLALLSGILLLSSSLLVGCNQGAQDQKDQGKQGQAKTQSQGQAQLHQDRGLQDTVRSMSGLSEAVVLVSGNTAYIVTDPAGSVGGAAGSGATTYSADRFGTSALSRDDQARVTSAVRAANKKIKTVRFLTNR